MMDRLYFTEFDNPWALLLLGAVALLLLVELVARHGHALTISTGAALARHTGGRRKHLRFLPPVLRALALTALVVALARPVQGYQVRRDRADIIDIMLCVDVSGSMLAVDFESDGQRRDRLTVTKEAVQDFIQSRKYAPEERFGLDRLGLVLYGMYAWTQCPLTLDYGILEHELERAQISQDERHSRTAIGSAIGLAVSRLRKSEAKSKIIILLTDGQNNFGELDPRTAAQFAQEFGIRIYTVGAGSDGPVMMPQRSILGVQYVPMKGEIDEETLRAIADISGGKYYRATDTASLHAAYDEIDKLEATEIEIGDYYEKKDAYAAWAAIGASIMAASLFVRRVWFEPVP